MLNLLMPKRTVKIVAVLWTKYQSCSGLKILRFLGSLAYQFFFRKNGPWPTYTI